MPNPLLRPTNMLHPTYQKFHQGMCAPEWRWFWQLAIFAEPIWSVGLAGAWDYSAFNPPNSMPDAHTYDIGPRGWRRNWSPTNDRYVFWFGSGSDGSTNAPSQYYQPNDCTMFSVFQLKSFTSGKHLLAWEGSTGDDGTANANTCMNISLITTLRLDHFHESGTGTNNNVDATANMMTSTERLSVAVTRTKSSKTINFWKNGLSYSSATYSTDCALGNRLFVSIGDRAGAGVAIDAAIECMYLFKTVLSPSMIVQLHRDPWGPFRSPYKSSTIITGPVVTSAPVMVG